MAASAAGRRTLKLFTVDAFTDRPFAGNPAAICLDDTEEGLPVEDMQSMAMEMNISETAFIRTCDSGQDFKIGSRFGLRWFTPTNEVPLCGHATLAAAAALVYGVGNTCPVIEFTTASGVLRAVISGEFISLDLPRNDPQPQEYRELEDLLQYVADRSLIEDTQFCPSTRNLLVRLQDSTDRQELEALSPAVSKFTDAHSGKVRGVMVTVKADPQRGGEDEQGRHYDFLSRYFSPWNGISEDPVTGSAHTVLGPYWAKELDKKELYCRQCSSRGGDLRVVVREDGRVDVAGKAVIVVKGEISL